MHDVTLDEAVQRTRVSTVEHTMPPITSSAMRCITSGPSLAAPPHEPPWQRYGAGCPCRDLGAMVHQVRKHCSAPDVGEKAEGLLIAGW